MPRANELRRLKIREVSSVDRGAGEGVRIMLMKRTPTAKGGPGSGPRGAPGDPRAARGGRRLRRRAAEKAVDLTPTIRAALAADDVGAAIRLVKTDARDRGLADQLPEEWVKKRRRARLAKIADALLDAEVDETVVADALRALDKTRAPDVLRRTHALVKSLAAAGRVDAVEPVVKALYQGDETDAEEDA